MTKVVLDKHEELIRKSLFSRYGHALAGTSLNKRFHVGRTAGETAGASIRIKNRDITEIKNLIPKYRRSS